MASARITSWRPRLPALHHRDFRMLWFGMLFASLTMAFQYYAQIWLIYGLSGSALLLGLLGVVRGGAMILFGLYGGVLADRMDRRRLLMLTEALALGFNGVLSVLAVSGVLSPWQAFILIFGGAAVMSVDAPIRQALIPELVPRELIPNAVALTTAARMGTFALTPVLAGFVIAALGPGGAYSISLFGHVAVVLALLVLRYRGSPRAAAGEPWLQALREGFHYARQQRDVLWVIVVMFLIGAFGFAIFLGPIAKWAGDVLGLDAGQYGVLAATWGVGTLVASYGLAFMGDIPAKGRIFSVSALAFGASFLLFSLTRSLPVAGFAYLINGAAWTGASITAAATVQSIVRNEMRGRVMSFYMLNGSVAQLNGLTLGLMADWLGMETMMVLVTGFLTVAMTAIVLGVPSLRQLDRRVAASIAAAAAADAAPATAEAAPAPAGGASASGS